MRMTQQARASLYQKSQEVTETIYTRVAKSLMTDLLNAGDDIDKRQVRCQALCDYLCEKANIPYIVVRVLNKPQPHTVDNRGVLRSKTLGTYTTGVQVITLYNLTAKQLKVIAIKSFSKVLIHEFIHHYDMTVLGFDSSLHTAGFYKRVSDLEKKFGL